jgi:hypothetical protein
MGCFMALASAVGGCGADRVDNEFPTCPAITRPAAIVTVRDSVTGSAAADGAIATLVDSGVDDTLFQVDSLTLAGGFHTGTFTATIDRPGYLTWVAHDVHVEKEAGPCGLLIPAQLQARLQPAPS